MKRIKIHHNRFFNVYEIKEWRKDKFIGVAEGWYTLENAPSFNTREEAENYLTSRFAANGVEYQIEDIK